MPGTDSYRDRYRSQRARGRARGEQSQGDAVAVALTAQVLICILLLLAAHLMKKADPQGYSQVRREYDVMVTDTSQNRQAAAYFTGGDNVFSQFFAAVEEAVNSLVERFAAAEPVPAPAEEADGEQDVFQFDYEYLNRDDLAYASLGYGQGGEYPVALPEKGLEGLAPPEGAVLSPVVLSAKLQPPVTGLVTSPFSYRYHPISGNADFHTGMDIAAPEGRAVLAALPGEVIETGESAVYGLYVIVEHAANLQTFYAHCSEIIAEEGMKVRQGERIAKVGQTGTATGPHLHFSVLVDGNYTDPYWVLAENILLVD